LETLRRGFREASGAREAQIMLKKIVVPVDGSSNSLRALDYAVELGRKFGSHIVVFNVSIPYDFTKLPPRKAKDNDKTNDMEGEVEKVLKETALKIAEKHLEGNPYKDIEYRQLVSLDPADRILELITHIKADAVVMGNRGLGTYLAVLAGSVSNKLIQLSKVPVIVVK
jgi:nucleotide-binding universal stress UspA family protein